MEEQTKKESWFRSFIKKIKKDTLTLYLCFPKLAWYKKTIAIFTIIYALSPIDLIPDFIPILGMLDDILIIPFGIWLCRKMIPNETWDVCRQKVENGVAVKRSYKVWGTVLVLLIWVAIVAAVILVVLT